MTNPNINQFAQTPVQGQLDQSSPGVNVFTGRVSASQATALIAGQAVKGDNATPGTNFDGIPPLLALSSNSDPCLGFVARNIKDINRSANQNLEFAIDGAIMYMTSDSTTVGINRFGPVEYNTATNTVLAWQGVNPICGYAWDAAINAGDLIRVNIKSPQLSSANTASIAKTVSITATQAQINAGIVLIPAIAGKAITLLDYITNATGTWATGTSILIEDTAASPVAAVTIATADIGNVNFLGAAGNTLGTFGLPLTSGKGLQAIKSGSNFTGGTNITFTLTYTQA